MKILKVGLGDPEAGWMQLTLRGGEQAVEMYVSDIYPSLSMLVVALHCLLTAQGAASVTWTCEPAEYDMVFARSGDTVTLNVLAFPDSRRSVFVSNKVLTVSGRYDSICLPFWRALRGLEGRFTALELAKRWTHGFPHQPLGALTEALEKRPSTHAA